MSVYNIIAVAIVGVGTAVFNALLSNAGYIAPELVDGVTVAAVQPKAVTDAITFSFVGLETITGLVLAGLLLFLTVEKTIARKQQKIREHQKAETEARGETWIEPEVKAQMEEEQFMLESEAIYAEELKAKCEEKGLNYEEELAKHQREVAERQAKIAEKKRLAKEKEEAATHRAEEKREARLAKLTPEQRAAMEEKARIRGEREEREWQEELARGEAYRARIQAELAAARKE